MVPLGSEGVDLALVITACGDGDPAAPSFHADPAEVLADNRKAKLTKIVLGLGDPCKGITVYREATKPGQVYTTRGRGFGCATCGQLV